LDWALDGSFEEEALAIRDTMEEDFLPEKMIARQKSKGKRELLNLQSSINYGDASISSRHSKVKERPACCRVVCFGGLWVFSRVCGFFSRVWLGSLWVVLGFLSWVLSFFFRFLSVVVG
jgi:hypothetical protein